MALTIPAFDKKAKDAFLRTLADPFLNSGHSAVWFQALVRTCPLLSFRRPAYRALHSRDIMSSYPLGLFVGSVCADDGVSDAELDPLSKLLDSYRMGLAWGVPDIAVIHSLSNGQSLDQTRIPISGFRTHPNYELHLSEDLDPNQLRTFLGEYDAYADIGRRLMRLRDSRLAARTESETRAYEEGKQWTLDELGLGGRRPEGVIWGDAAKQLDAEARVLFGFLLASELPDPSEHTVRVLRQEGVADEAERALWAARLALPILSAKEIGGLSRYSSSLADKTRLVREAGHRRFSIFLLARRLRMDEYSFARKVRSDSASRPIRSYIKEFGNPIDWAPI